MKIKIERMFKMGPEKEGNLKAFCDVTFGGLITVNGCRVISGKNGLFATLPQKKKDDKWEDIVKLSKDLYTEFKDAVINHYNGVGTEEKKEDSNPDSFDDVKEPAEASATTSQPDEFEE